MNLLKLLLKVAVFAGVAVAAIAIAGKVRHRSGGGEGAAADAPLSPAGFFLLKPEEAGNHTVIIMSPPNCPSREAQRATALAQSLAQAGVPHQLRSEIGFTFRTQEEMERVDKIMNSIENPLVLVRGWAKGNPTLAEVLAEYRAGSGK